MSLTLAAKVACTPNTGLIKAGKRTSSAAAASPSADSIRAKRGTSIPALRIACRTSYLFRATLDARSGLPTSCSFSAINDTSGPWSSTSVNTPSYPPRWHPPSSCAPHFVVASITALRTVSGLRTPTCPKPSIPTNLSALIPAAYSAIDASSTSVSFTPSCLALLKATGVLAPPTIRRCLPPTSPLSCGKGAMSSTPSLTSAVISSPIAPSPRLFTYASSDSHTAWAAASLCGT
mmetsp:Transcript_29015/g.73516  ORF Transcript_29015/g.73516 Transcript_29015/m.73516 type:complete len:234 (+) Transcript_29015:730-1431(+)